MYVGPLHMQITRDESGVLTHEENMIVADLQLCLIRRN